MPWAIGTNQHVWIPGGDNAESQANYADGLKGDTIGEDVDADC